MAVESWVNPETVDEIVRLNKEFEILFKTLRRGEMNLLYVNWDMIFLMLEHQRVLLKNVKLKMEEMSS